MNEQRPAGLRLNDLLRGYINTQVVYATAKLGLPDLLAAGPRAAEDLAAATGADGPSVRRLLRAAASLGLVEDLGDGSFAATDLSEAMRSGAPGGIRNAVLMHGEEHYRAFADLAGSVRSGEPAFTRIYGEPIFEYFASNPGPSETFNAAMTDFTRLLAEEIVEVFDFSDIGTLMDVGGGSGTLLARVLRAHPDMRGIVFDLPSGVTGAEALLEAEGVKDRCRIATGSFFDELPRDSDAMILKNIVHDWDDEACVRLLTRCREALEPGGRVLLVERVMPERVTPEDGWGPLLDMVMMVMLTGRERTEREFRELIDAAGLSFDMARPMPSGVAMIEAVA